DSAGGAQKQFCSQTCLKTYQQTEKLRCSGPACVALLTRQTGKLVDGKLLWGKCASPAPAPTPAVASAPTTALARSPVAQEPVVADGSLSAGMPVAAAATT